jgi:hypothetical protein
MPTEVDWNSSNFGGREGGPGGGGRIKFLKFQAGKTTVFRPIGKAVTFCKFFIRRPDGARTVIVDVEDKDRAQEILSEAAGQEMQGNIRYAMNVIDREDGEIKILEGGNSIFKYFANWARANNAAPGSMSGGDWSVTAEGEGQKRRYTTGFLRSAPLSAEEVKKVKTKGEMYTLVEIFKSTPLNDIVDKAFGERSSSNEPEPDSSPQGESNVDDDPDDPINW